MRLVSINDFERREVTFINPDNVVKVQTWRPCCSGEAMAMSGKALTAIFTSDGHSIVTEQDLKSVIRALAEPQYPHIQPSFEDGV